MEAFQRSAKQTAGRRGSLFLAALVLGLISMAGLLALGLGIFLSAPVAIAGGAAVYLQLRGEIATPAQPAPAASPVPDPPADLGNAPISS